MPDVYTDAPIQSQSPFQGYTRIDPLTPENHDVPLHNPYSSGTNTNVDPLANLYSSVTNSDWAKSENVTTPGIRTPVNFALRYLQNLSPTFGYDITDPNLEQKYGAEQGFWIRGLNRLLKFGATAAVSFATTVASRIDSMMGQDASTDPSVTAADEWVQKLEDSRPNFQTAYQKENPVASYFTPWHFLDWMDNVGNVGQNMGFTVGAIAAAVADPLNILAGAGVAATIGEGLLSGKQAEGAFSAIGKLGKVLAGDAESYNTYNKLLKNGEGVVKALDKAANTTRAIETTQFLNGVVLSAYGESIMEGNNAYIEMRNDLKHRYMDSYGNYNGDDATTQAIERSAKEVAQAVVPANFAFLSVSNMFGLGTLLRPGAAAVRATESALAEEVSMGVNKINPNLIDAVENAAPKGLGAKLAARITKPSSILSDNLREAGEEGYQFVVSQSAKDYYTHQFDAGAYKDTVQYADSFAKGMKDLFGTNEGIQNMLLGFLSGALQHGVKHIVDKGRGASTTTGDALAQQIKGVMEPYTVTGLFNPSQKEAVAAVSIASDMEKAVKNNDLFAYKNFQFDQLFNFVESGVRSHKFNLRIDQLNSLKNLSKDNFETLFNMDFNETNQKNVSQYIDNIIDKAQAIKSDIDKVNMVFGRNPYSSKKDARNYRIFEDYKGQIANLISQQRDHLKRAESVRETIFKGLPGGIVENAVALSDEEGVQETISRYKNKIKDLTNSKTLAENNTDLQNKYQKEIDFLQEHVDVLKSNMKETNPDMYLQSITSLYNYINNGETLERDQSISEIDSVGLFANGRDLHRINRDTERIRKYYRDLTSDKGFTNFTENYLRSYTGLMDRVKVGDDGNMTILTDEELATQNTPADPTQAAPASDDAAKFVKQTLGVNSLEEGEQKIDDGDKNVIASLIDPSEEVEEEGDKSLAQKIRDGEVEVTPQMKKTAKTRLKQEFTEPEETEKEGEDKTTTSKAEKRAAKMKKAAEQKGVNVLDSEEDNSDINDIMEEDRQKKASSKKKTVTTTESKEPVVEESSNPFIRFWDKFLFSPLKELNRVLSLTYPDVDYKGNLEKLVYSAMTPKLLEDNVVNKMRVVVQKSTQGKGEDHFTPAFTFDKNRRRLYYDNIHRAGFTTDAVVYVGDTPVGLLHPPLGLRFKRGDEYLTLDKFDNAAEYAAATHNPASSFEQFKKDFETYRQAYDKLLEGFNPETKLEVSNEKLLSLFRPIVSYGSIDYTTDPDKATRINRMKYRGKGDAILSFPTEVDINTGTFTRSAKPIILNEANLTDEQITDTLAYVADNLPRIHEIDTRYIYLLRNPQGGLDAQSVIAARPANESTENLDSFVDQLKAGLANEDKDLLSKINAELGNSVYVSYSKGRKASEERKKTRTLARFYIAKEDKLGYKKVAMRIVNKHSDYGFHSIPIYFNQSEINKLKNFDEFLTLANSKIEERKKTDRTLMNIGFTLTKDSFKSSIPNDTEASIKDLEGSLTVATTSRMYKDAGLTFMPAGSTYFTTPPVGKATVTTTPVARRTIKATASTAATTTTAITETGAPLDATQIPVAPSSTGLPEFFKGGVGMSFYNDLFAAINGANNAVGKGEKRLMEELTPLVKNGTLQSAEDIMEYLNNKNSKQENPKKETEDIVNKHLNNIINQLKSKGIIEILC